MKFATFLLLVALLLSPSFIETTMAASSFCGSKCSVTKASRKDRCLKYCGICCDKCHCVPSGTYGNKDELLMGRADDLRLFQNNADGFICSTVPGISHAQVQYSITLQDFGHSNASCPKAAKGKEVVTQEDKDDLEGEPEEELEPPELGGEGILEPDFLVHAIGVNRSPKKRTVANFSHIAIAVVTAKRNEEGPSLGGTTEGRAGEEKCKNSEEDQYPRGYHYVNASISQNSSVLRLMAEWKPAVRGLRNNCPQGFWKHYRPY
ncbi:hypothetical protein RHSIM_RhsimUnG0095100 [Rhododendron simsii]|uniref:Uncharacterized protein n=1 Tax=Rhododendron simsii TaxID=118357 RepID=A0A834L4K6_RHOSS|nr:hypothetical protein RHSIM_RhsimUnG0095100 [Rhododendron simsii]